LVQQLFSFFFVKVHIYEIEFLKFNGDKEWLKGIEHVPRKLQRLSEINKYLAHQPWLIDPNHIEVRQQLQLSNHG
jgi:hypothetical protein